MKHLYGEVIMSDYNERLNESLSALVDDEASDIEVRRILEELASESTERVSLLREKWLRLNAVSSVLKGNSVSKIDYSGPIAEAIRGEESLRPGLLSQVVGSSGRFAVAASAALVAILGVQELNNGSRLSEVTTQFAQINDSPSIKIDGPVNQIPFGMRIPQDGYLTTVSAEAVNKTQYSKQKVRNYVFYILAKHSVESSSIPNHGISPYVRVETREKVLGEEK